MCGILFLLGRDTGEQQTVVSDLHRTTEEAVCRRGPTGTSRETFKACGRCGLEDVHLIGSLFGSVLHMRGDLTLQPLCLPNGDLLLWNGEIFNGVEVGDQNDTQLVGSNLQGASANQLLAFLSTVRGPWAFVFWQAQEKKLYFGRDFFGRRSLVWHHPQDDTDTFSVTSVTGGSPPTSEPTTLEQGGGDDDEVSAPNSEFQPKRYWEEVPALGVFCLNFGGGAEVGEGEGWGQVWGMPLRLYRWSSEHRQCGLLSPLPRFNTTAPTENELLPLAVVSSIIDTHTGQTPEDTLSFFGPDAQKLLSCLSDAVRRRVQPLPSEAPRIAVLFSGGIDSTLLALLADRHIPAGEPIDLINVAFGNVKSAKNALQLANAPEMSKKGKKQKQKEDVSPEELEKRLYNVPDRATGTAAAAELARLAPDRPWHFVEVNIPLAELEQHKAHVLSLMHPLNTVMDLSIACAMWFAARGTGNLMAYRNESCEHVGMYTSPARALLIGIGADEQLGGYGRHRTKYNTGGWPGLVAEIKMDVDRIAHRNLGRDDRVVSDHGREARFPFLDEDVVSFLNSLPVWIKADMRLPRGYGEKVLLRQVAQHLGLQSCAPLPKRAIQFGSRVAKIESAKEKGTDKC